MKRSGRCSTTAHLGSIGTWFLSASNLQTWATLIPSSTSKLFPLPSKVNALMKSFCTLASRIFSSAKRIFSAFARLAASVKFKGSYLVSTEIRSVMKEAKGALASDGKDRGLFTLDFLFVADGMVLTNWLMGLLVLTNKLVRLLLRGCVHGGLRWLVSWATAARRTFAW